MDQGKRDALEERGEKGKSDGWTEEMVDWEERMMTGKKGDRPGREESRDGPGKEECTWERGKKGLASITDLESCNVIW